MSILNYLCIELRSKLLILKDILKLMASKMKLGQAFPALYIVSSVLGGILCPIKATNRSHLRD